MHAAFESPRPNQTQISKANKERLDALVSNGRV